MDDARLALATLLAVAAAGAFLLGVWTSIREETVVFCVPIAEDALPGK
ncbi:hypothetical protein NLX83_36580 [Allokutzneria sp. A3M-2-11 16]|nr:hypothetical protein [Allokutzneria sp. A3M-2-11 16]MCP3804797.1 hypothetical protein [Allokutzneria sp. A3M-2-11 16]